MPPKVYVPAYPAGDFRAMPALGAGHALLKWVTSFPGNPAPGLPTVTGLVLLSDASNGLAAGGARRGRGDGAAHRRGRGARGGDARPRGRGDRGGDRRRRQRARRGTHVPRARPATSRSGTSTRSARGARPTSSARDVAGSPREALAADLRRHRDARPRGRCFPTGSLQPGQHVSLMGADGPGKAEIAVDRARARRASSATTGSRRATTASSCTRSRPAGSSASDVTELGAVLAGDARGPAVRRRDHDLRLDRARDPGPRDRARGDRARGRARSPEP